MRYYKDTLTGTHPVAFADPVDLPGLVEIDEDEFMALTSNAGADYDHPMRHEVVHAEAMAASSEEAAPPEGTTFEHDPQGEPGEPIPAEIDEEIH